MSAAGPQIPPNDPRLARCGFAKLQGDGIEFFIRKYEITIGRSSKNSTLDLVLGDNSTISRQHASIRYNFDTKCFELVVLGKNGVQVESSGSGAPHLYTPDSPPTPLRSRDLLIMGEKRFYFLLPRSMGFQSRKRRRMEPSPAPGADTSSAPQPTGSQLTAPASITAHPAQLTAAPTTAASPPAANHHPQQSQPALYQQPGPSAAPVGASCEGALGVGEEGTAQVHNQQQQQYPSDAPGGAGTGTMRMQQFESLQDDEEALINAGALPYDNGAPYGYGAGNNGFAGAF